MVAGLRGGLRVLPFVVGYGGFGGFGGLCVVSAGCVVYVSSFVVGVVCCSSGFKQLYIL